MPEALQAFEDLKKNCMTAPILVFTDFKKPFGLETDASREGLGAVGSLTMGRTTQWPLLVGS